MTDELFVGFEKSKIIEKNEHGLLEGYHFYLFMDDRTDEYISRLNYIKKNIPETEYLSYGAVNIDQLIMKLAELYKYKK
ncbi:hypothetical protein F907_02209 [Acinetobacter colistiniresistens]|uniref:Uncharacterized protein n=1 Tax=Acinetobacter colistiniresistens TaxID=280145 RepID=S3UFK4_9GAMM|nr:hypothetical protein [Acinetobacter colistiniresistens]EPG38237.1 hypothetical protein F907_02209 [Acinetobacter colistiniresistens]TVT79701.1 hypothetical protein FPV60_14020 [Acinetobacter colistiniresistens]